MPADLLLGGNQPPIGARGAEPLSLAEIDMHPDSNRIWATILQMRETHEAEFDEFESDQIADLVKEHEAAQKELDDEIEGLTEQVRDLESENFELKHLAA